MDGFVTMLLLVGKLQVKPIQTVLLNSLVFCGPMKTGRLTLARLSEDNAGYRMHIVTGGGVTSPQWVEMGIPLPSWSYVKYYPTLMCATSSITCSRSNLQLYSVYTPRS